MKSICCSAKNFSNVFVDSELDSEGNQEVYLSVHIIGGSISTRMTKEQAAKLAEALQTVLATDEQAV